MGSDLKKRDLFDDPILTYWLRKRKNYKKIPPNIPQFLLSYIRWDIMILSITTLCYLNSPRFFFGSGEIPFMASSKCFKASFCSSVSFSGTVTTSVT